MLLRRIPNVPTEAGRRRRGIVLILSLGMLTLFTIVAITLASISRTQSTAAANFKRAEQYGRQNAGVRPEQVEDLFRYAMNQLIYDTRNQQSAIRGHSLLRDMYGSPESYQAVRNPQGYPLLLTELENTGAEFRLRKEDLKRLAGLPVDPSSDRHPRVVYQGIYNGPGLPLPTKQDSLGAGLINASATPAGVVFGNTRLTNAEIALQMAFPHMPMSVAPFGKTFVPVGTQLTFQSMMTDPSVSALPNGLAAWFPRFSLNYTVFDPIGRRGATTTFRDGSTISPEKYLYHAPGRIGPDPNQIRPRQEGFHWFGADEDYDYPDINNMFLALERADGRTLIPSFHRPGIIGQVAAGLMDLSTSDGSPARANVLSGIAASNTPSTPARLSNAGQLPWLTSIELDALQVPRDIRALVLRPRASDHDPATVLGGTPRAGRFREMADNFAKSGNVLVPGQDGLPDDLDGSGFIGDHPSELDVDTDGDGLNDAVWIDLGYRPIQVGDALIKPLFAFKVIDLDGKLNLNVHGNLHAPVVVDELTGNPIRPTMPGQHSSHLGASVTEINPQYGLILGDTPADNARLSNLTEPQRPVWLYNPELKTATAAPSTSLAALDDTYPHPYQRLVRGFTDSAGNYHPGRWSSPTRDVTQLAVPGRANADDNANLLTNTPTTLAQLSSGSTQDRRLARARSSLHSVGSGEAVIAPNALATAPGIPATSSPLTPADVLGVGKKVSAYSKRAVDPTTPSAPLLRRDMGQLLSVPVEYSTAISPISPTEIANYLSPDVLSPWGYIIPFNTWFNTGTGLPQPPPTVTLANRFQEIFAMDEALEINPWDPLNNDDFFYSASDLAALWRAGDIDGPSSSSRLTAILSSQVVPRTIDISESTPSVTPPAYSREAYTKKRQQRMFTHASWDLNRYSSPPGMGLSSLGRWQGSSIPDGARDMIESLVRSTDLRVQNVVNDLLSRKHNGSGVPSVLANQLVGLLPDLVTNPGVPQPLLPTPPAPAQWGSPIFTGVTNNTKVVLEQLAARRTVDGRDFLIPYEVQLGRRFDLNRPLLAYTRTPSAANPTMLNLIGVTPATPEVVDRERESIAQQIYVLLSVAAGLVGDTGTTDTARYPTDAKGRVAQARVLAQIAVNIVDYMDPDSVMTQMRFDPYLADGWSKAEVVNPRANVPDFGNGFGGASLPLATQWVPSLPRDAQGNLITGFTAGDEWNHACTVIGFELPEIVINEAMSVVQEDFIKVGTPPSETDQRNEVLLTWVELMNPWPATPDPVSPIEVDTADPTKTRPVLGFRLRDEGGGLTQSRFMLGITASDSAMDPIAPDPSTPGTPTRFVLFDGSDGSPQQPAGRTGTKPVILSRDRAFSPAAPNDDLDATNGMKTIYGDYGYFVVGPKQIPDGASTTFDLSRAIDATNYDGANLGNSADYTANACGQVFRSNRLGETSTAPTVSIKLYRVRNPFLGFDATFNPYVAIDTVELSTTPPTVQPIRKRNVKQGNEAFANENPGTATGTGGIYYTAAVTRPSGFQPATWPTAEIIAPPNARNTWQRRQPWHGWPTEWTPYSNPTTPERKPDNGHPLVGRIGSRNDLNLEGAYLGLPSLANSDRTVGINPPSALRQNGFYSAPPSFLRGTAGSVSTRRTRGNGSTLNELTRWQTIPFANRQLATPLELLNVRLYGSHAWEIAANIYEWRLRFTDDFEFFSHGYTTSSAANPYFERLWRSRPIPWFSSDRITHPTWGTSPAWRLYDAANPFRSTDLNAGINHEQSQLPLGNLYRFFELVECRSRLNNGFAPGQQYAGDFIFPDVDNATGGVQTLFDVNPTLADLPAYAALREVVVDATGAFNPSLNVALQTRRQDRVPGKINLNTITEEEVYKGLVDSVSAMYFDPTEFVNMITNFYRQTTSRGYGNVQMGVGASGPLLTVNYWPLAYFDSLFTPLGPFPLGNPQNGDTLDAMGDLVPWNASTFARSGAESVLTPPEGPAWPAANSVIQLMGGMEIPTLLTADAWQVFPNPNPLVRLINSQWPGIATGPALSGVYPGTAPTNQVSSEMYRAFLLSRAGADGITGTADDRPFRSFAAMDVEDTLLRSRSPQTSGIIDPPTVTVDPASNNFVADFSEQSLAQARTWMDGVDDITADTVTVTNAGGGTATWRLSMGGVSNRLGGQVTPRLFDPIDNVFADPSFTGSGNDDVAAEFLLRVGADAQIGVSASDESLKFMRPDLDTATLQPKSLPADYWLLDEKRNALLAKIGGNTTTRSHVFAVWVTVGFFRVEPGTENLKVPLLGAEVGSETNRSKRHRAFFVIDRSQATEYEPEDIDANFDLDRLRNRGLVEFYKIIE